MQNYAECKMKSTKSFNICTAYFALCIFLHLMQFGTLPDFPNCIYLHNFALCIFCPLQFAYSFTLHIFAIGLENGSGEYRIVSPLLNRQLLPEKPPKTGFSPQKPCFWANEKVFFFNRISRHPFSPLHRPNFL